MVLINHGVCLVCLLTWISLVVNVSGGLNLGLISGDFKKSSSPLFIKKCSKHSPVTINIRSNTSPIKLFSPLHKPKLPKSLPLKTKLKSLKKIKPVTSKLNKLLTAQVTKSKLKKLLAPKIPKIPKLPLLPLSLLPIIPPLPLLPLPILPPVLKPLKIPLLKKKTPLQIALGSETIPVLKPPSIKNKIDILKTLTDLKKKGSLTTAEFLRFKKILL